jgi:hypothetical protein
VLANVKQRKQNVKPPVDDIKALALFASAVTENEAS